MKIIDEKGRLLGLINIIDLFVLLMIVFVAVAGVMRFTGARTPRSEPGTVKVMVDAVVAEVREQTVDAIQVGDVVRDSASGQVFGTIIEKEVEPTLWQVKTADGRVVLAEVPDRFNIVLRLESRGHDLGSVLRIASHEVRVGTAATLQARKYSVLSTILDYEIVE